jgi:low affinity Fe/Cu permease
MNKKSNHHESIADSLSKPHHHEWFGHMARITANAAGKPVVFLAAVAIVIIWAAMGPMFGYSDTWQLVINTGTTIVTFLMVFLIQNTQNRDQMAVQLKLGELILAIRGAENRLAVAEDLSDEELEELHQECKQRADRVFESLSARRAAKEKRPEDKQTAKETGQNKKETGKNGKHEKADKKAATAKA